MENSENIETRYNYDEFTPAKVFHWLNFKNSPPVGTRAPDFTLWHLNNSETSLREIWSSNLYTIVEFGSFT